MTSDSDQEQSRKTSSNWLNVPNSITFARLVLAVVLFWLIWVDGFWITSAIVFVVAATTDWLDGYLARKYQQVTVLGRIMDPFVDKIIICGAFVFLLDSKQDSGINGWVVTIVLGREMFVSSLRGILEEQGKDFSASFAGKAKMALQCVAVTVCLLSMHPDIGTERFVFWRDIAIWTSVAATVWSGLIYVVRGARLLTR